MTPSSPKQFISRTRGLLLLLAFTTAACIPSPSPLFAQELSATQGGLGGTITDKSGAAVPGAQGNHGWSQRSTDSHCG